VNARGKVILALSALTFTLGLSTGVASAEPVLDLDLTRTAAPVTHSDERLAYEITVANTAGENPVVGNELTCVGLPEDGEVWFGNPAPTFEIEWLRNGTSIPGTKGPPEIAKTYTITAADEGQSIQCLITATNDPDGAGSAFPPLSFSTASLPPVVVQPAPSPAPPSGTTRPGLDLDFSNPDGPVAEGARPVCKAPIGWSDVETWSFQWLRNGVPAPHAPVETTATSSKYELQEADVDPPSVIQCQVTARDAQGNEVITIGPLMRTVPLPPDPYISPAGAPPVVTFTNKTEGLVTVDAELPAGSQALRADGSGWSCIKRPPAFPQPSTAKCTREDSLQPGSSYPPIKLVAQVFRDAPDTLLTKVAVSGGGALNSSSAEDTVSGILPAVPFGFEAFEVAVLDALGADFTQAGGHPFSAGASLELTDHVRGEESAESSRGVNGSVRVVRTDTPAGFTGNPEVVSEKCQEAAAVVALPSTCPAGSAVGGITLDTDQGVLQNLPVYAIEAERGTPAQFAFGFAGIPPGFVYTLTPELRAEDGYAISLVTAPVQKKPELYAAEVELCGFGAKVGPDVDPTSAETEFKGCRELSEPEALERPFLSLPTRCGDPASTLTEIYADTWEEPGSYAKAAFRAPDLTGCDALDFEPSLKARPTASAADSPTGLEVDLEIPQNEDLEGTATAHLDKTVVTLPEGLVINPSGANGLGACGPAQIALETNEPVRCPDSSKVGSVEAITPILDHPLPGALYIATPHQNPFSSLLALYLVIEDPETGILIKLPGLVEPDPRTGRLTTTFDDNPQAPVEAVKLNIRGGAAAPLRTPLVCGRYTTTSSLTPWSAPQSGPPATPKDTYTIRQGPNGGPCVSSEATMPNDPAFEAGATSPIAAASSPFVLELRRADGSQRFSTVTMTPPPGLLAKLAGVAQCADTALAAATAKSGRTEQASPSCPPASEVGSVVAGAGAGPAPYFATGKVYLAGPYKGAPLSLAIVTPAVAGPFDIGTIVVRTAMYVDPETARVTAKSDPLPTILQGIPLDVRSATISLDRPGFTLNPTSCDPMAVGGTLISTVGQSAPLSSRFQLAECGRLSFKPNLRLRLHGSPKRAAYQRLVATVTAKPGEANIASAAVTLPRSAFLAQNHIRTVCTRVQFAAKQCPRGSIYGNAVAITPLLDQPLRGPVYLRSSSNPLPDLVVALRGPDSTPIEVELAGRVDSKDGGIRNSFELVPDAPVTKFTLRMRGGKKSLIVNSRNLCKGVQRATVRMTGQNGKKRDFRPLVKNDCRKKKGNSTGQKHR
jgi:hypothetical protein